MQGKFESSWAKMSHAGKGASKLKIHDMIMECLAEAKKPLDLAEFEQ